jgi:hypothetical protein
MRMREKYGRARQAPDDNVIRRRKCDLPAVLTKAIIHTETRNINIIVLLFVIQHYVL